MKSLISAEAEPLGVVGAHSSLIAHTEFRPEGITVAIEKFVEGLRIAACSTTRTVPTR
jgi:hypothetical protein